VQYVVLFFVLESISILALLDCWHRGPDDFAGGVDDREGWILWLWVAVATSWFLVGNGIVLGYYFAVIRRNTARY
jgi:hypothetical protein